jgi:hypothetical protein
MFLLSISRRHYLKVLLQKAIFIVFVGLYYYPSPTWLSDLTPSLFRNLKKMIFKSLDLMISPTIKHDNGLKSNIPKVQLKRP